MRNFLLLIVGCFVFLAAPAFAAAPTSELAPKEAVRLIAMRSEILPNTIEIAFIVEGSAECGKGFEVRHVRRVAAIHAVREGTSQSRKLVFYDLFWNEALGWFMWESRLERAGEAVYLWSELKGEIANR